MFLKVELIENPKMVNDFTVDKVGWHTNVDGNTESRDHIIVRFWTLTNFLQENNLTLRKLARSIKDIDDEYCIKASDLTEDGLTVLKASYDKWLKKLDKGGDPTDTKILDISLKNL